MYLQKAKLDISNDKENSLIWCLFKTKSGHKVSKTKGISYFRIREIFKGYISEITTTLENFGLHSLRSGGASSAANNGVSDSLISKQSRWFSEKVKNGDIKDSVNKRLTVSNTLGLWKTFKAVKKMSDNYFHFDSPVTNQYNSPRIYFLFYTLVLTSVD